MVIKSADATILSALKLCELIKEANFPVGAINLPSAYGNTVGNATTSHMDIDKVAFTGSNVTERDIMKSVAASSIKRSPWSLVGNESATVHFVGEPSRSGTRAATALSRLSSPTRPRK